MFFEFQIDESYILSLTSSLEPDECLQLLFCTLAREKIKIDPDVENLQKLVTNQPGKYKQAHKFGNSG